MMMTNDEQQAWMQRMKVIAVARGIDERWINHQIANFPGTTEFYEWSRTHQALDNECDRFINLPYT